MKAVVLAGGLRSGSEIPGSGMPRALWPFPHEPLIVGVMRFLAARGCEEIAICANGKTKLIATELDARGAGAWMKLHYSEDPLPRGPAGCLKDLEGWLTEGGAEQPFVAIQGTGFYDFDLEAMQRDHDAQGAALTVGARRCPDDPELLEPAGVYLVEPSALALVQEVGYQDFKEQFIPKVIGAGLRVHCHTLRGRDGSSGAVLIHSPGQYLSAMREAIGRCARQREEGMAAAGAQLPEGFRVETDEQGEPRIVHETARIDPGACVAGPAFIGPGAVVEAGAVLAGTIVLAQGARVGAGALLHRVVVLPGGILDAGAEAFSTVVAPRGACSAGPRRWGLGAAQRQKDGGRRGLRELLRVFSF